MRPARLLPGQRFGQPPEPAVTGVVSALASFIQGCIAANNGTDPLHDLDMSAGGATMVSGNYTVAIPAQTKRFDTAWAAGTNQGGALQSSRAGKARTTTPGGLMGAQSSSETVATTTHDVVVPPGIQSGDLLVLFIALDGNSALTVTGWTPLLNDTNSTIVRGACFYKTADGTETNFTFSSGASAESANRCLCIRGGGTPTGAIANGASTNGNPPSHDSGTTSDKLWVGCMAGDDAAVISGFPSGFLIDRNSAFTGGTTGVTFGIALKEDATQTVDPGAFTSGNDSWVAMTVAVPITLSSTSVKGTGALQAPVVLSSGQAAEASATTTHNVVVPFGLQSGDLLMLFFSTPFASATTPSGWTLLSVIGTDGNVGVCNIYLKTADGTETNFTITTGTSVRSVSRCLRITGWSGTPQISGGAAGSSTTPDPDSLNSGLGTGYNKLFIAAFVMDGTPVVTAYPTGFNDNRFYGGEANIGFAMATDEDTTQTLNPGAFTKTGTVSWGAFTISVAPDTGETAFDADFAVGDLIYFDTTAAYRRVTAVTSAKLMTISETLETAATDTYKRHGGLGTVDSDGGTVFVYGLYNPTLDLADYGMSRRSATPVDLPSGYTEYRRIASFKPDANDDLVGITCMELSGGGVEVLYTTPIEDVDVTDLGAASTTYSLSIPSGHKHHALIHATVEHASARARVNIRPLDVTDQAPSQTASPLSTLISQVNSVDNPVGRMQIRTNTSGQIAARSDQATTLFGVVTLGYVDHRRAV